MALISHDDFLDLSSLAELKALYRDRGFEGADKDLLRQAQLDWHEVALQNARQITEKPEVLDAISCTKDGVTYEVYGVIHGLLGGDNKEYKDFVNATTAAQEWIVFENGLNLFYKHKAGITIPDFMLLGWLGSLAVGFHTGFMFPQLIFEFVLEALHIKRRKSEADLFDFNPLYHAVDPETRRGIMEDPPLPSRLQIEYEMDQWDRGGFLSKLKDPFAIVPRSMFMAGFAEGCAQRTGKTSIPIVVGDLHATEIQRFYEGLFPNHPIYEAGRRFARREGFSRIAAFAAAKTLHLGLAGLAGTMVLAPFIAVFLYIIA